MTYIRKEIKMRLWEHKYNALRITLDGLKLMETYQVELDGVKIPDLKQKISDEMDFLLKEYGN